MYEKSPAAVKTPGVEPGDIDMSLEDCIANMARGDTQALHILYTETKGAVYGFALSILKNPQDAEDVLQDTFINAYASARTYTPMQKPMAWILTIARNLALMKLRQHKKRADAPWYECERAFQESASITRDDILLLRAAMCAISGEELQIVVLHAVSGFKHREIARFLELPLSTVLSKYSRALQKLKAQLVQEESK